MKSTAPAPHLRPNVFLQELGLLFYLVSFLGWAFEVAGFGAAGALIALYGFPLYERLVQTLPSRVRLAGLALLSGLFLWDVCTALVFSPNMGLGVTGIG